MSAPNNGGKPRRAEYTAPSRKNARAAQKPMRDIGVEQFKRPGGTLLGAGHVRPGSAFDTLARKKGRDRFEVARDQVGGKTGAGDEADLDCKTGRDNDTDDPADAPDARGDMPGQVPTPLDLDESLWGKQDDTDEAIEPQESNQQESTNKILQNLRPNVVRPAPASRNLKANAGAWGASKLKEPEKDVVDTAAHLTAANRAMIRRRLLAVKNKPTAEERFRKEYFERTRKPVVETAKRQAPVDSPSPPRRQPPQKGQRKRRASSAAPVFSSEEEDGPGDEDEDDDDEIPIAPNNRRRHVTTAPRPQLHKRQNQKATSALSDKAVVEQLSQEGKGDDDEEDDEDDEDDDDLPTVQANRRRRTQPAPPSQANSSPDQPTTSPLSSNSKAAAGRLLQTVQDVSSPLSDKALVDQHLQDDDDDDDDPPIAQTNRRRRSQPAPPPQTNNSPDQPDNSYSSNNPKAAPGPALQFATEHLSPLSNRATFDQLLQLGAQPPPSRTPELSHVPMARFPPTASMVRPSTAAPTPGFKAVNGPRPQSQLQPQLQPQTPLPKKETAHPPQPKRARATIPPPATTTKATTAKEDDATPSPPRKKSRAAPKGKTDAKTPAPKPTAKTTKTTAAPIKKKGAAAVAGKKGVATKVIEKKPKPGYDKVSVTDESGSDHDSDW